MWIDYTSNSAGDVHYYYRNHQGSVVGYADGESGAKEAIYTYDAYGNSPDAEANGQPYRYTGRRYDAETGLYYYRARYYSPKLGRFLQVDPIGYEDTMNLYGYTANDPINNTDPTGEEKYTLNLKAMGGLIGGVRLTTTISFDTENFELGGSVSAGAGEMTGVAATGNLSIEPSTGEMAKDELGVSFNVIAEAKAGLGVVGTGEAKVKLVEANTTDGLKGADGEAGVKAEFGAALAAGVTGNVEVSGKSSALAVISERLGYRPQAERYESERKDD